MSKSEQFIARCDKTMAFSFYALIYFLPISIALSEIFTVLALVSFLLKRGVGHFTRSKELSPSGSGISIISKVIGFLKSFKPISNPLNRPIAVLLFLSFVSILFSQYRVVSLNGFLGKMLQSAFLYFNFIECMNSRKRLKIFFTVFFISCTLICINGIFQGMVGHGFIHGHGFNGRISSSLRAANDFGAYLVVIIPVLFCITFLNNFRKREEGSKSDLTSQLKYYGIRFGYFMIFLLGFLCLGFTYSRGAWVGFILSLLLMGLLQLKERKIIISHSLLSIIFLLAFYPGISLLNSPFQGGISSKGEKLSSQALSVPATASQKIDKVEILIQEKAEDSQKAIDDRFIMSDIPSFLDQNNRLGYWKRSFKIIKDYPIFGCGLNAYALVAGRYNVGWGGYPHNSYLQMAAETGVVGILVFLWLLFVLFRSSFRALRKIGDSEHKILFIGVLTGLMGFLIHSFFDTNFYSVQLGSLMWIVFGIIMVMQRTDIT